MLSKIKKIIKCLKKSWENRKRDPVTECDLYKDKGCVFVDGPFCDFPYCTMNNEYVMKNVMVYPHMEFDKFCMELNIDDSNVEDNSKFAFISIIGTEQVIDDYLGEHGTRHFFNHNHPNVMNLEFDDVGKDFDFTYNTNVFGSADEVDARLIHFKTISEEQAKECVDFIDNNIGKTFVIHCRAGRSRSQAIYRYIVDMYEEYKDCKGNLDNPCLTPNQEVVRKLKREYYKKHNIYIE